ncbi:MAG: TRAP transporter large permease [Chloroflexi bacterium]|nr:TRAP transporter large permease [Chloroflexota bacterium]
MYPTTIGLITVAAMFLLLVTGMNIAVVLLVVGFTGFALSIGFSGAIDFFVRGAPAIIASYALSAIPLFLFMGAVLVESGYASGFYKTALEWVGHIRGGLAMASVAACGIFGAACGSSVATAAAVGSVAIPEMMKYKYSPSLAVGAVAGGGTVGNMIPPSVAFVIFGIITEQPIGQLLIAGLLPGISLVIVYMLTVRVWVMVNRDSAPASYKATWRGRMTSLQALWPALVLFFSVMGSIYLGVATPTEASGIGALSAVALCFITGRIDWTKLKRAMWTAVVTTSVIGFLVMASMLFSRYLNFSGAAQEVTDGIVNIASTPWLFFLLNLILYVILGCFLEGTAMMLITVPLLFPVALNLGFSPIWYGVFMVLMTEIGLITPPVGLNVFVLGSLLPEHKLGVIFKGALPFVFVAMIMAVVFFIFPEIALFLPGRMK